ncbi:preprotein translocase subunit SecG [Roseomonas elaeocarpi]|uniref:Protein-export membrane protein SecG n=1 Tax=Roseomonas elaeocarpi TaxID=907779 RepID=A0ABV6JXN2_9PROT
MTTVLLVLHFIVALALIGVVLLQRSEGGGLGIGSTQGMGAFMTGRGTANLLTRSTAVLATLFFVLAVLLGLLNRGATQGGGSSILDNPPSVTPPAATGPALNAPPTATPPGAPAAPAAPGVPNN